MKAPRARDGVIAKMIGNEMVLLDYDRGIYYGLNPVGARVWQLLSEGEALERILERLADEYEVSREALESDVAALLLELEAKELVQAAD
ncbi:MAG: PqqD family protein [Acidobacteriota bacterium]